MKLRTLACFALLALPQVAYAQPTAKDREAAIKYLDETRERFLKAIDGVTEAQWTFKAGPDRWSIAETAEHITISESTILQLITEKVMKAPKPASVPPTVPDQAVIAAMTDRTQKAQAPEMLKPTNRWATRDALTEEYPGGAAEDGRLRQDHERRPAGTLHAASGSEEGPRRPSVGPLPLRAQRPAYRANRGGQDQRGVPQVTKLPENRRNCQNCQNWKGPKL